MPAPRRRGPAPKPKLKPVIRLLGGDGAERDELEAGETLLIAAQGLRPDTVHAVTVRDEGGDDILTATLLADRYGAVVPTVLWPDVGIGDPKEGGRHAFATFEEAAEALGGHTFVVELAAGKRAVARARLALGRELSRPRLYSANEDGAPRRGLLLGEDELRVRALNFPGGELADVFLVERQSDWRPGDPIRPIMDTNSEPVMRTFGLREGGFDEVLWGREQLRPGGYDIVARVTQEHEWRRDELILRRDDLVSDRFVTSVVVRQDVFKYKPIHQGCVNAVQVAGRLLGGNPYFQFTDNFPVGTDVWATLDPAGLMPGMIGKKVRYYVCQHKDATGWNNDPTAVDVNGAVHEAITADSCINVAERLVWSNPQVPGKYDLVVDFGNMAANPANFVADGQFNPPDDMIDGAVRVGFYVTNDPGAAGGNPVGHTTYNDPAVTIPANSAPGGTIDLPMVADVSYPATVAGTGTPVAAGTHPLLVVMHGMHGSVAPNHTGYTYLLDHFASRGYIAVSFNVNPLNAINELVFGRGHAVLAHLDLLRTKNQNAGLLQGKIDMGNIAIMGHSRGGDGVVQAEVLNQALPAAQKFAIKAVIPLAPTDFTGTGGSPLVLSTSKLLCIYGGNDGDVWGGANPSTQFTGTGFRFYDRATVEKAMVFVPRATHNRFNTVWGTDGKLDANNPILLDDATHHNLLVGYMTAFLEVHIEGKAEQNDYMKGEITLPQASSVALQTQYRPDVAAAPGRLTLDDFETNPAPALSSLNGTVTFANIDGGAPTENTLGVLDPNSPHQTRGMRLKWSASSATYRSEIPLAGTQRNLTPYGFLSFRVCQVANSAANPAGLAQDLYVRLSTAGGGPSRAVRAGYFMTIPPPYKPDYIANWDGSEGPNTKSALLTVRIPLHAWTVKALSAPIVDITNVESIGFDFMATGSGELDIDDVELTG
jgi:Chlorophyllase enzyme